MAGASESITVRLKYQRFCRKSRKKQEDSPEIMFDRTNNSERDERGMKR